MEPVTHMLTGACLSKAGLNRKAAYATLTMVVAAEFPDIDVLWSVRGPVESLQHHRGITHTFVGLPLEAAVIVAAVYGVHRFRAGRVGRGDVETAAPVRWGLLYGFALLGLLSHLLLDYTNNYGIRPFFPFDRHWYAGSFVFIFDPLIFAILAGALVMPLLFGLVGSELGAKKAVFRGRGWAIAALCGMVAMWSLRAYEHGRAIDLEMGQSVAAPVSGGGDSTHPNDDEAVVRMGHPDGVVGAAPVEGSGGPPTSQNRDVGHAEDVAPVEARPVYLQAQRALASPDPLNPFRWSGVIDYGPVYQLNEMDTSNEMLTAADGFEPKPDRSVAVLAAEASQLGRAYVDWSSMPLVQAGEPDAAGMRVVTFRDPRFLGGWMGAMGRMPLTGTVTVDAKGRVVEEVMDGRVEGRQ